MAIRMAKLTRTRSGLWTARKVIPADVRDVYGKREEKPTWPASLTQGQARAEFGAWLLATEERITSLRCTPTSPLLTLSERQTRALAGKWYRDLDARFGDNPGAAEGWEIAAESVYPEQTEEDYQASLLGHQEPYEGPWRTNRFLQQDLECLLAEESLNLTEDAANRLLQEMAGLYATFCALMVRRANGDYGHDRVSSTLPAWEPPSRPTTPVLAGPTIMEIFDGYVAERKPAEATIKAWKRMLGNLAAFLNDKSASQVTADDMISWKDHLMSEPTRAGQPRSAKTVRETYLAAAKTVFGWAKENRKIADNPALGITVRGGKKLRLRDPGFTNEEAATILRATMDTHSPQLSQMNVLARRWVPWLCAYSGARVNEITQLRKMDVVKRDGVWAINITPEAGSVKTGEARLVPIHSHLIEQGFVAFAEAAKDGPLFFEPKAYRGGSSGNPQHKKVGERLAGWVRSLGITDENVAPNHGWRHRFKTTAREAGMDPEAREVIPGHVPSTEGGRYGGWTLVALSREIERLPRFEV
jgi:integrase